MLPHKLYANAHVTYSETRKNPSRHAYIFNRFCEASLIISVDVQQKYFSNGGTA